jgi:hypothetical protein
MRRNPVPRAKQFGSAVATGTGRFGTRSGELQIRGETPSTVNSLRYVETIGMTREEALGHLREAPSGVLSLAWDGRAYAVPISHTVRDGTLYLRLTDEGTSEKLRYLEQTTEAAFVCYGEEGNDSWSVVVRGALIEAGTDKVGENRFEPIRVFGDDVEELTVRVFTFEEPHLTARRTIGEQPWEVVLPRD